MGLRFRRSFRLIPGIRLNVSKSGVSASVGVAIIAAAALLWALLVGHP